MNPKDVFPRRNLPNDAEPWGREVETRIRNIEYELFNQELDLTGLNRSSASQSSSLARQIRRLQELFALIPKPLMAATTVTGFGLSGGWTTVAQVTLTAPQAVSAVAVKVDASALLVSNSTSTNVETQYRLVLNGSAAPAQSGVFYAGTGEFRTIMAPSFAWQQSVAPGATITAQFQVLPTDAASYPANALNYAALTADATFTG